ncbi:alpha/beta-hydrolase [Xylariaceae sp. FL0016]|nr:alpha/beta-hydrolase [Xylariaceae sp. FL0016]
MAVKNLLANAALALLGVAVSYAAFLAVLTVPFFQNHVIYLHSVTQTWGLDTNFPEQWGFLRNQVTPFHIRTSDGEVLHAWHVLPLQLYTENEDGLLKEPKGLASDINERLSYKLLREDPDSLLVIYLHGAGGTLGSGWRPPSYRAMSAAAPRRIHTVAIDYRGFGASTGSPSEAGLLQDALALAEWAVEEAGIPPSRIVLFGQSIGTAVCVSLAHHLAHLPEPVFFSGMVLVAPFADVELLTATYRVAGTVPILGPVAKLPGLLSYLNSFIESKWPSKDKLAGFVRAGEAVIGHGDTYRITLIHSEDDSSIPWAHSDALFWHAVNASLPDGWGQDDLNMEKATKRMDRGAGGWMFKRKTQGGWIKEEILKYGFHDRIMSYPAVSRAVADAFGSHIDE